MKLTKFKGGSVAAEAGAETADHDAAAASGTTTAMRILLGREDVDEWLRQRQRLKG